MLTTVSIGLCGVAATAWTQEFRRLVRQTMTDEQIRFYGWIAIGVFVAYCLLVFWLKPKDPVPTPTIAAGRDVKIGGFHVENLSVHAEDRSLKRRLRDLFREIDARILDAVQPVSLLLTTRMTEGQYRRFVLLLQEQDSGALIQSASIIRTHKESIFNNGTFGPTTAEADQHEVKIQFQRGFCHDW